MSELPDVVELEPRDEAQRLWQGAAGARARAAGDLVALIEVVELGLRAVEILVIEALGPIKDQFPATIAIQLERPRPEVDTVEDATTVPNSIHFTEILDLLSGEGLECVAPGLHRGWEDRRFSCKRSRVTAQEALGLSLEEAERADLLLLSAYRNRIFRAPPPVRVVPGEILGAFGSLERLMDRLL
jgi:hypothetical protein